MSTMSVSERRFREGAGQRYLASDPNRIRCHGVSKTRLREARIKAGDPTLASDDVWPAAQCPKAAVEGTYLCNLHGGKSITIRKSTVAESMPVDLYEKFLQYEQNRSQLVNRINEIGQLLARNAQLYESLEDLVLGEEAYYAIGEARDALLNGDVQRGLLLIGMALEGYRTEKEVWDEVRKNTQLVDKLTTTQFNIEKELKLMTTMDQMKNLLDGLYRGTERILAEALPDNENRSMVMKAFSDLIRNLANARHGSLNG